MKLLNKFLLTLTCAATIFCCSALTPEQQVLVNEQLRDAALSGDLQEVQLALAAGADIHANNDRALRWAALEHDWAVVAYLLQQGAERAVLSANQLNSLYEYVSSELQTALGHDDWHRVEELLSILPVKELPHYSQQEIRNILIPAVQKKLDSVRLGLFTGTQIRNTDLALRTLSFIVGPRTRAAFSHLVKEDTHEITQ